MITNAYNYLNFPPVPAQILLNLEKLPKRWYYKCIQLLNFFPLACPNLVEFREIAKEVNLRCCLQTKMMFFGGWFCLFLHIYMIKLTSLRVLKTKVLKRYSTIGKNSNNVIDPSGLATWNCVQNVHNHVKNTRPSIGCIPSFTCSFQRNFSSFRRIVLSFRRILLSFRRNRGFRNMVSETQFPKHSFRNIVFET